MHDLRGMGGVLHHVGVNKIQHVQVQDQVKHIEFVLSSAHLPPAINKSFKVGYAHDREIKSAMNNAHKK